MYYAEIKNCDIANGPGVRVSLFVSGCTHHCEGCFNEMTWEFDYGEPFDEAVQERLLELLAPDHIAGLTLLGGEPLEYVNMRGLLPLVREVRRRYPGKTIWCYTGYLFERDILERFCEEWDGMNEFLACIDVLVDGEFVPAKKDISLRFRGSSNQRLIDVPTSLAGRKTVLWEGK